MAHRYFIINKPYNMVSQFVSPDEVRLLSDIEFDFPEGTHAVGRLDNLSEGLLILTTNKKVTRLLFQGEIPHKRTYLVRVKKKVSPESLEKLKNGIDISSFNGGTHLTAPCDVVILEDQQLIKYKGPNLWDYNPSTWLLMTLTEGRFHQVRKMVSAVGHRCERLVRVSIEDLELGNLLPGEVMEIEEEDFFKKLKIADWRVDS